MRDSVIAKRDWDMRVVLSFCWQFWPKWYQNKFKKQSQCEKMSKVYVRVMLTVEALNLDC